MSSRSTGRGGGSDDLADAPELREVNQAMPWKGCAGAGSRRRRPPHAHEPIFSTQGGSQVWVLLTSGPGM